MASNASGKLGLLIHRHMNGLRNIGPHSNAPYKCVIEKSPFDHMDDDDPLPAGEYKILAQIFPKNTRIYANRPVRIEIKLTPLYPNAPPEVRISPKVFHQNVAHDGQVCIPKLFSGGGYEPNMTLVEVIEEVTKVMDEPLPDMIQSTEAAALLTSSRDAYETKAREVFAQNP